MGYHSVDDLASVEDPQRFLVRGTRTHAGHSYEAHAMPGGRTGAGAAARPGPATKA